MPARLGSEVRLHKTMLSIRICLHVRRVATSRRNNEVVPAAWCSSERRPSSETYRGVHSPDSASVHRFRYYGVGRWAEVSRAHAAGGSGRAARRRGACGPDRRLGRRHRLAFLRIPRLAFLRIPRGCGRGSAQFPGGCQGGCVRPGQGHRSRNSAQRRWSSGAEGLGRSGCVVHARNNAIHPRTNPPF